MSRYSKCKNCGGEEIYSPQKAMLVCERCGSTFPVKESKSNLVQRVYDSSYVIEENKNIDVSYRCLSCGTKSVVGYDGEVKRCSGVTLVLNP